MAGLKKTVSTAIGDIELRGLKRGEVKDLRLKGVKFGQPMDPGEVDAAVEKSLAVVLTPEQMECLDDLYESEVMELYLVLTQLTYPDPDRLKNSA